jgi:hypothetical protein
MTSDLRKTPKRPAWFPGPRSDVRHATGLGEKKKPPAGEGGRFRRNKPAMLIAPSRRNWRWLEKWRAMPTRQTRQQPFYYLLYLPPASSDPMAGGRFKPEG